MKTFLVIILIVTVALWGYVLGRMTVPIVRDSTLDGMTEVQCNDIVRETDGALVCEVDLKSEDQKLLIYKEMPL